MKYSFPERIGPPGAAYSIVWDNTTVLGQLVRGTDGYYSLYRDAPIQGWDEAFLLLIQQKLNSLNRDWDEKVRLGRTVHQAHIEPAEDED